MPKKCKFYWTEKGCRNKDACPYIHDENDIEQPQEVKKWFILNRETCKKAKNYSRNLKNFNPNNIKYISVTDNSYIMTKEVHDENIVNNENVNEYEIEYKYVLFCGENEELIEKCLNNIIKTELEESQYDYESKIDYARIRTKDGEVSEYGKEHGILYVI